MNGLSGKVLCLIFIMKYCFKRSLIFAVMCFVFQAVVCYRRTSLNQVHCGRSWVPQARVVSGADASIGEWPWQAWLDIKHMGFTCGGSLVNPEWVVTAAHCILKDDKRLYRVTLGDTDRTKDENTEQVFGVKKIIKHRYFSKDIPYDFDVALLRLSRPAQLNAAVNTICLPQSHKHVSPGTVCYITGWGMIFHKSEVANILQEAPMPVVSNHACAAQLAKAPEKGLRHDNRTWTITDNMICAGDAGKTKSGGCYGDSGGPLACKNAAAKWVLEGIVSWGDPDCSSANHYTVFTRVTNFRQWIEDKIDFYKY